MYELINWDSKAMSTGVDIIDEQHQKLVCYFNELYSTSKSGGENNTVSVAFKKFYLYIQYHFLYEEEHLFKFSKTDVNLHKRQHQLFIEELLMLEDEINKIGTITVELLNYFSKYLTEHLCNEDMKCF